MWLIVTSYFKLRLYGTGSYVFVIFSLLRRGRSINFDASSFLRTGMSLIRRFLFPLATGGTEFSIWQLAAPA